ncbi:MAG: hypothetical protein AWU57_46 [Marinobacter sp. T13-3]|nr:MAG: hypothetical protein AWU57_46 [Marinobacter sp. T13-3]
MAQSDFPRFKDYCSDLPRFNPIRIADGLIVVGTIVAILVSQFSPPGVPDSAALVVFGATALVFWQLYNWGIRVNKRARKCLEAYKADLNRLPLDQLTMALKNRRQLGLTLTEVEAADAIFAARSIFESTSE